MKKLILSILLSITILIFPVTANATVTDVSSSVSTEDLTAGFVEVFIGYAFRDGSFDPWKASIGAAVNKNTVVTLSDLNIIGTKEYDDILAEKAPYYLNVGVDLTDSTETLRNMAFRVWAGTESFIPATAEYDGNLAILTTSIELGKSYAFSKDSGKKTKLYAIGTLEDRILKGRRVRKNDVLEQELGSVSVSAADIMSFTSGSLEYFTSAPIVDDEGLLSGLVIGYENGSGTAILSDSVKAALKRHGKSYVERDRYAEPDQTELNALIRRIEETDYSAYEENSVQSLKSVLADVKTARNAKIKARTYAADDVSSAITAIKTAESELKQVVRENSGFNTTLVVVLAVLVGLILASLYVFVKVRKAKREKQAMIDSLPGGEDEDEDPSLDMGEPEEEPRHKARTKKERVKKERPKKGKDMPKEAEPAKEPVREEVAEEETPTTVLEEELPTTYLEENAFVIRMGTSEKVKIETEPFCIGRAADNQFIIRDNTSISRKHCRILSGMLRNESKVNVTKVDGKTLAFEEETELKDGSEIILANELFKYVKE